MLTSVQITTVPMCFQEQSPPVLVSSNVGMITVGICHPCSVVRNLVTKITIQNTFLDHFTVIRLEMIEIPYLLEKIRDIQPT